MIQQSTAQEKQQAEHALETVFRVGGSTWSKASRTAEPAHAEWTTDGDPQGLRHYHWNAAGSPPAHTERYIESIFAKLLGDRSPPEGAA